MPNKQAFYNQQSITPTRSSMLGMTLGVVVDTNDPRQMGRIRVMCPAYGDTPEMNYTDIPWCIYVSPFGGMVDSGTRGPTNDPTQESTNGPVAYGMWNIPKVGANALVSCLDGDGSNRIWLGCVHAPLMNHTMPHGTFTYQQDKDLPEKGQALPDGPLSSQNEPINPLYKNQTTAFTPKSSDFNSSATARQSFEFRTRASDFSVGGLTENTIDENQHSFIVDDQDISYTEDDGTVYYNTQGYDVSRLEPDLQASNSTNNVNYDPQTYSWVTPGFHAISMDDRVVNTRMRLRTTSGHQIILDDTNERIYISTSEGETWIELDQKGNIDVYAGRNLSVRAEGDINFTTNQTFRVTADKGIHLASEDEVRIHSKSDTSIRSEKKMNVHAEQKLKMSANNEIHLYSDDDMFISSNSNMNMTSVDSMLLGTESDFNVTSFDSLHLTSGSTTEILSTDNVNVSGAQIHLNTALSEEATDPEVGEFADNVQAFLTSRVPSHEPWARVFMSKSADKTTENEHVPEYSYNSEDVGRKSDERSENYNRNENWHR